MYLFACQRNRQCRTGGGIYRDAGNNFNRRRSNFFKSKQSVLYRGNGILVMEEKASRKIRHTNMLQSEVILSRSKQLLIKAVWTLNQK